MINIEKIIKKFDEYVSNYSPNNERIKLKIEHIKRVSTNCEIIAKNLQLSQDDINLAIAIGYFHDIGRFEQVRIANTFSDRDSKINHGEYSVKILFENNFIREFIEDTKYDDIIKIAVLNHNKAHIDNNLSEKELLFSKIIRDADKLDIYNTITLEEYSNETIFWYDDFNCNEINEEMLNDFIHEHFCYYSKVKNNADVSLCFFAYIFDLNFSISYQIISEQKYLEQFTERAKKAFNSSKINKQLDYILQECNSYLRTKI